MFIYDWTDVLTWIFLGAVLAYLIIGIIWIIIQHYVYKIFYKDCKRCKHCKLTSVPSVGNGAKYKCELKNINLTNKYVNVNHPIWKRCNKFK